MTILVYDIRFYTTIENDLNGEVCKTLKYVPVTYSPYGVSVASG